MSLWEILVLGVVRLTLDIDYDRLKSRSFGTNYDLLVRLPTIRDGDRELWVGTKVLSIADIEGQCRAPSHFAIVHETGIEALAMLFLRVVGVAYGNESRIPVPLVRIQLRCRPGKNSSPFLRQHFLRPLEKLHVPCLLH